MPRVKVLFLILLVFIVCCNLKGQVMTQTYNETYPSFPACAASTHSAQASCFNKELLSKFYEEFQLPPDLSKATDLHARILVEVDQMGEFSVLHIQSQYESIRREINKAFSRFPVIEPAVYNGRPTYMQFSLNIPLQTNKNENTNGNVEKQSVLIQQKVSEYDTIITTDYDDEEYESQLTIPFSHQVYSRFDKELNEVGTNSHTAGKPYIYQEVAKYHDFKEEKHKLLKNKTSWWGRKFWNEHMVGIKGDDYWFTLDPAADLMLGRETATREDQEFTYNNTRAVVFQGGLGKNLNFHTVFYESQGSFAGYFNRYARSLKPDGGNPAVIPGRGIASTARGDDFDYPVATGYLSYTPSKFFNLQAGHGKQFIGDGYRSLLLSDNTSPYPFVQLNTSFWKLKYSNTLMSLRDVRPAVTEDGSFRTKYMVNHYLSYNVTRRLNLGFFESVIWENENDRGLDLNYLNPVIFYHAIEFVTGSRGGNVLMGLSAKYKFSNQFNAYAQVVIDEFSIDAVTAGNQSYKNKQGFQLGLKYYDAFQIKDLQMQLEFNQVRPYTYSHNEITLNYGHNNQSMAHQWGASFTEYIALARYEQERWYATAKLIYGKRGLELGAMDEIFYGADIYGNDENRPSDDNNAIGQGNQARTLLGDLEIGYLLNPATNLKLYASALYRDQSVTLPDPVYLNEQTLWFNLGFRTDLFNWYFDR